MHIEKYMFKYIDAINEENFKEAVEILQDSLNFCNDESSFVIKGFIDAAKTLDALKYGDFDIVEDLWLSYEKSKSKITPKNRYYSIFLEMSLIVEDIKEYYERII
ncbi:hypothetical protein [Nitrosophilus kaiyonis]|uniref:hypothetical protein n=1 Tax=Nitrosophilus kaiyonis TaxID=2930200 RepID=UPI0024925654|nr:hypothetical protein [Nitrosophilus kaiyonis]